MWRRKDEKTKDKSVSRNWRDKRLSKESGERKESGEEKESGELREMSSNWRIRKQEGAERAGETGMYGEAMPAEWKLQKMYKQLKINNNKFITWLVEKVYPCSEGLPCSDNLPPYITLTRNQGKGEQARSVTTSNAILTTSLDHPKYDVVVNNIIDLARQINEVPPTMLSLLERLIVQRSEYTHWMSRKSTDNLAKISTENHIYYIKVLKEANIILAKHVEPETKALSKVKPPDSAEITKAPVQTHSRNLGKRKVSAKGSQNTERGKAARLESTNTPPKHLLDDNRSALLAKPTSYAAALRVAVA